MSFVNSDIIDQFFDYHPPTKEQADKYTRLNANFKYIAKVIAEECPDCRDRDVALDKLREARMWVNATIACNS